MNLKCVKWYYAMNCCGTCLCTDWNWYMRAKNPIRSTIPINCVFSGSKAKFICNAQVQLVYIFYCPHSACIIYNEIWFCSKFKLPSIIWHMKIYGSADACQMLLLHIKWYVKRVANVRCKICCAMPCVWAVWMVWYFIPLHYTCARTRIITSHTVFLALHLFSHLDAVVVVAFRVFCCNCNSNYRLFYVRACVAHHLK